MAHDDDQALLSAWLEQVGRTAEVADGPDERSYKAIALELGLTEADLARVEAAVEAHIARGRNYLAHGRPGDAVTELAEARAMAPWRADVAHGLAEAHVARYHADGSAVDRSAAEHLIRARLEQTPDHQPSYTLLNRLDQGPPGAKTPPTGRQPGAGRRAMLVAGAGVVVMLLISGLMAWLLTTESADPTGAVDPDPPPVGMKTPPAESPPAESPPPADTQRPYGTYELPVEVVSWDKFEGIEIEDAGSTIGGGAQPNARLKLRVRNALPGQGLDALAATVELLDDNGIVVTSKRLDLLNSAQPTLYPGEQHAYGNSLLTGGAATRARVILESLTRKAAEAPPESRPICVKWAKDRPEHLSLEFGLRGMRWSLGTIYLDLTVRNTGANAVADLELHIEHLDADDQPVKPVNILDKKHVAASWMPPFDPGELRLVRHMKVFGLDDKPRYDHTCLRVTEVD